MLRGTSLASWLVSQPSSPGKAEGPAMGYLPASLCPWAGTGGGLLPLRLLSRRYRLLGVAPISHLGCWTTYRSANLHGGSAQAGWPHEMWSWLLTNRGDLGGSAEAGSPQLPIPPAWRREGRRDKREKTLVASFFPKQLEKGVLDCPLGFFKKNQPVR